MLPFQKRKQTKTPAEREADLLIELLQQFGARWEVGAVSRGSQEASAHQQAAKALVQLADAVQQHKAAARRGDVRLAATAAVPPSFLANLLSSNGRSSEPTGLSLQLWGALLAALQGLARWIPAVLDQQLAPVLLDVLLEGQAAHMTAHLLVLGLSQWHLYQIWPLWGARQVTNHLFNQLRQLLGLPVMAWPPAVDGPAGSHQQQQAGQQQAHGSQVQRNQQRRVPATSNGSSSSSNTAALLDALRGVLALLCHVSTCSSSTYAARLCGPPAVAGGRLAAVLHLADRKELLLADHGMQQLVMQLLNSCLAVESVQRALFDGQRHSDAGHYSSSKGSIGDSGAWSTGGDDFTTGISHKQQLLMQCQLTSISHAVLSRPCILGESLDVNITIWVAAAQALSSCSPLWATAAAAAGLSAGGAAAAAAAGGRDSAESCRDEGPGSSAAHAKQHQQLSDITAAAAETLQGLEWLHRGCSSLAGELAAAALQLLLAASKPVPHTLGSKPLVTPWMCHLVSLGSHVRLIDHLALLVESSLLQLAPVAAGSAVPGSVWGMQLTDAAWLVLLQLCGVHAALSSSNSSSRSSSGPGPGPNHSDTQTAVISRPQLVRLLSEYGQAPSVPSRSDAAGDASSRASWLGCVRLRICRGLLSWTTHDQWQLQGTAATGSTPYNGHNSSSGGGGGGSGGSHLNMVSVLHDLKHALAAYAASTATTPASNSSSSREEQAWSQSATATLWLQSAGACIAAADACRAFGATAVTGCTSSNGGFGSSGTGHTTSSDWQQLVALLVAALQLSTQLLLAVTSSSCYIQMQALPGGSGGHVECVLAAVVCLHTLSEVLPAAAVRGVAPGGNGHLPTGAADSAWPAWLRFDMEGVSKCLSERVCGVLQQLVLAGQPGHSTAAAGVAGAYGCTQVTSSSVTSVPSTAPSAAAATRSAADVQHQLGCLVSCWAAAALRSCFGQVGVSGDLGSCLEVALEGGEPPPDALVVRPAAAGVPRTDAGAFLAPSAANGSQQGLRQQQQGQEEDACGELCMPVHAVLVAAGAPVLADRLCRLQAQRLSMPGSTATVSTSNSSSSKGARMEVNGELTPAGASGGSDQQQLRLVLSAAIPGRPLRWLLQLLQVGCCRDSRLSPLQHLLHHQRQYDHQFQQHEPYSVYSSSGGGSTTTSSASSSPHSSMQQALQAHRQEVQLLRQLAKKMQVAGVTAVCGGRLGVLGCRLPPPHPWLHQALPQQQLLVMVPDGVVHDTPSSHHTEAPAAFPAAAVSSSDVGGVRKCDDAGVTGPVAEGSRHAALLWQPVGPLDPLLQQLPGHVSIPVTAAAAAVSSQQVPDTFADVCLAAVLHKQQQDLPPRASSGCPDDRSRCHGGSSSGSSSSSSSCSSCRSMAGCGCHLVMVPAHSVVLSSRCTYFEALLSSRWQQEQPPEPYQAIAHAPAACAGPASCSGLQCAAPSVGSSSSLRRGEEGSSGGVQYKRMRLLLVPGADAATLTALQHWLYTGCLEHRLLPSVVAGSLQQQGQVQPGCDCPAPGAVHVQQERQSQADEERAAVVQSSNTGDQQACEGVAALVADAGASTGEQQQGQEPMSQRTVSCSSGEASPEVAGHALQQPDQPEQQERPQTHISQHREEQPETEGAVLASCASCAPAATFLRLWQVCDLLLLPQLQQQCAAAVAAELQQLPGGCLVTLLRLALEVGAAPLAEQVLARLQQLRGVPEDAAAVTGTAGSAPAWPELLALPSELQQLLQQQQPWHKDAMDAVSPTGGVGSSSGWVSGGHLAGACNGAHGTGAQHAAGPGPEQGAGRMEGSGPEQLLKALHRLQSLARS